MKVLVVVCIAEYIEQLHQLFQEENITSFFETDAKGFNIPGQKEHRVDNWFADHKRPVNSIVSFVMIAEDKVDQIFEKLRHCNAAKGETDAVRAFTVDAEKYI